MSFVKHGESTYLCVVVKGSEWLQNKPQFFLYFNTHYFKQGDFPASGQSGTGMKQNADASIQSGSNRIKKTQSRTGMLRYLQITNI